MTIHSENTENHTSENRRSIGYTLRRWVAKQSASRRSQAMSAHTPEKDINMAGVDDLLRMEEIKRNEPFLSRRSDVFGVVEVFAPYAPIESWKELPWTMKVERFGKEGARRFKIKPDCIMPAFNSPGLVESHRYLFVEEETTS